MSSAFTFIDEATVTKLLSWPLVIQAVDQALRSVGQLTGDVASTDEESKQSVAVQPARTFTRIPSKDGGVLLTMPGYIGNYQPNIQNSLSTTLTSTLACKLVTMFPANSRREPPIPSIAATIVLFDNQTGLPKAVLGATEITTWRTVAASLVATKHLWFGRHISTAADAPQLAIVGAGVQGRMHAIGMVNTYKFSAVRVWNRTRVTAEQLVIELRSLVGDGCTVSVSENVAECVRMADIVVTATFASEPLIQADMLKKGVHINAVGAGLNHHSELADNVYAQSTIYVDSMVAARSELATLGHPIAGQVGEIILEKLELPGADANTVFQSMGMAVEDAAVAQAVFDVHRK